MPKRLAAALLMTALASCGAKESNEFNGNGTVTAFVLTSDDIKDGQSIPAIHSCDGANQSPALRWTEPPNGTRSLALFLDDPDAGPDPYHHWGLYDIPAATRSIKAGASVGTEAMNDGRESGYTGPCPPKGDAPHHYHFKLYAVDVDALDVPSGARVDEAEAEAKKHQIAMATLTATYQRK